MARRTALLIFFSLNALAGEPRKPGHEYAAASAATNRREAPVAGPLDPLICGIGNAVGFKPPAPPSRRLPPAVLTQFGIYRDAMVNGLRQLDKTDFLPKDTVYYQAGKGTLEQKDYQTFSGPTDIGMKLIANCGLLGFSDHAKEAKVQLEGMLDTLERLRFNRETGLFYRLYNPRGKPLPKGFSEIALQDPQPKQDSKISVIDAALSAIDNFHLYLGLYTVSRQKHLDPKLAKRAKRLMDRMHFSAFYDPATRSMGGNLHYSVNKSKDTWTLEGYRAGYNSEMRQLLTGLYALDGLRDKYPGSRELEEILRNVRMEFNGNGELMTWVGGGFESDLAAVTLGEARLSCAMAVNSRVRRETAFKDDLLAIKSGDGTILKVPHVPSASIIDVDLRSGEAKIRYEGNVGKPALKDSKNRGTPNDDVIVPHAVLLLASQDPALAAKALKDLEQLGAGESRLFDPAHGWLVSAKLSENPKGTTAKVNEAQTAVDGYFALVGILTALDKDQLSPSARALQDDPEASKRLANAYGIVDRRFLQLDIPKSVSLKSEQNLFARPK